MFQIAKQNMFPCLSREALGGPAIRLPHNIVVSAAKILTTWCQLYRHRHKMITKDDYKRYTAPSINNVPAFNGTCSNVSLLAIAKSRIVSALAKYRSLS